MPHGAKDWSKYGGGVVRYSLQDMAELAARMGSPDTYDRRGEVVWIETWGAGIGQWTTETSGAGPAVRLAGDYRFLSDYSLYLLPGTAAGNLAGVFQFVSLLDLGRVGFEVAVRFATSFDNFYIRLRRSTASEVLRAGVQLDYSANEILYADGTSTFAKLADLEGSGIQAGAWHHLKVVADLETGEYVRALYDENEYDMSGIALPVNVFAGRVYTRLDVYQTGSGSAGQVAWVGPAILTSNEP